MQHYYLCVARYDAHFNYLQASALASWTLLGTSLLDGAKILPYQHRFGVLHMEGMSIAAVVRMLCSLHCL